MNSRDFVIHTEWVPRFNWKLFIGLMLFASVAYIEGTFHSEGLTPFAMSCHVVIAAMAFRWCGKIYRNPT